MNLEAAIKVETAAPDSHFRLCSCPVCKGDNVAYVQYLLGTQEPWKVCCFDCGYTVDKQKIFRHEAQVAWNKAAKGESDERNLRKPTPQSLQGMSGQIPRLFGPLQEAGIP